MGIGDLAAITGVIIGVLTFVLALIRVVFWSDWLRDRRDSAYRSLLRLLLDRPVPGEDEAITGERIEKLEELHSDILLYGSDHVVGEFAAFLGNLKYTAGGLDTESDPHISDAVDAALKAAEASRELLTVQIQKETRSVRAGLRRKPTGEQEARRRAKALLSARPAVNDLDRDARLIEDSRRQKDFGLGSGSEGL